MWPPERPGPSAGLRCAATAIARGWRPRLRLGALILGLTLAPLPACRCESTPPGETAAPRPSVSPASTGPEVLTPEQGGDGLRLVRVAREFWQATDLQFVPGRGRLAVVLQKPGHARLVTLGGPDRRAPASHASRPLFDVAVRTAGELGLLGLAFHPRFQQNGLFYVNSTPQDGARRTRIAEWRIPPDRLGAEPAREQRVLLEVEQPYDNHNAGQLAFGPDGMLYVGLGDGGGQGDPHGNGPDRTVLLGKLLRLDPQPSGSSGYTVPPDNPFVGRQGVRPEIWASGLRNPWRFSFDAQGQVVVGDVGQYSWEEVDVVRAGDDLGWSVREGRHCHRPRTGCERPGLTDPVIEYGRSEGQSVTGGVMVTGSACPTLRGRYLFADFVQGRLWSAVLPADRSATQPRLHGKWAKMWVTFGRDPHGDAYVVDYGSGDVFRVECEGGRLAP